MTETSEDFLRATRGSYDAIAGDYAAGGEAPVADLGNGPGGVTALRHELGVPAFGVDLSPGMVALARETHPQLRFHTGSMTCLDIPSEPLGGIPATTGEEVRARAFVLVRRP
ncbi:class I SAM-dependent methyltransferase [Streptomyces malaysiense]|uniref:class I SAM-dependent methyltransferase n=1 Tax=Streptomyces malaysiense TaxID=1428626 RepID=UPI000B040EC1